MFSNVPLLNFRRKNAFKKEVRCKDNKRNVLCKNRRIQLSNICCLDGRTIPLHFLRFVGLNKIKADFRFILKGFNRESHERRLNHKDHKEKLSANFAN